MQSPTLSWWISLWLTREIEITAIVAETAVPEQRVGGGAARPWAGGIPVVSYGHRLASSGTDEPAHPPLKGAGLTEL
jgi:hypothetical protein